MTTNLSTIEAAVAERAKADRRRLAAARAKADEKLGARLRELLAPGASRAHQVEKADAWLTTQEEAKRQAAEALTEPEHSEGDAEQHPAWRGAPQGPNRRERPRNVDSDRRCMGLHLPHPRSNVDDSSQ